MAQRSYRMYLEAEVWTVARTDKGNAVMIRPLEGPLVVPIFIGSLEAQNILLGMGEVKIPRPMTHDLVLNLLKTFSAEISQVEIHTLNEGTFFASVVLSTPQMGRITLDARPTDALALAVRAGCPIFIEESIVEETGVPLQNIEEMDEDSPSDQEFEQQPPGSPLAPTHRQELEEQLEQFVADENYEEAARIRDEIKNLPT